MVTWFTRLNTQNAGERAMGVLRDLAVPLLLIGGNVLSNWIGDWLLDTFRFESLPAVGGLILPLGLASLLIFLSRQRIRHNPERERLETVAAKEASTVAWAGMFSVALIFSLWCQLPTKAISSELVVAALVAFIPYLQARLGAPRMVQWYSDLNEHTRRLLEEKMEQGKAVSQELVVQRLQQLSWAARQLSPEAAARMVEAQMRQMAFQFDRKGGYEVKLWRQASGKLMALVKPAKKPAKLEDSE